MKQPDTMACWATVYAMMKNWKNSDSMAVEASVRELGEPWGIFYDANCGLSLADEADFLRAAGLEAMPPANHTAEFYSDLICQRGPLWITTADDELFSAHARLLVRMERTRGESEWRLEFVDPSTGGVSRSRFSQFAQEFEKEAKQFVNRRYDGPLRVQVIAWPASREL